MNSFQKLVLRALALIIRHQYNIGDLNTKQAMEFCNELEDGSVG